MDRKPEHHERNLNPGLVLRKLRIISAVEQRLAAQPGEQPGLPFDRFLLAFSESYRATRRIAEQLGIRLRPRRSEMLRQIRGFDPCASHVDFPDRAQELRELLAPGIPLGRAARALAAFKPRMWSAFHDLNHHILFRLVSPAPIPSSPAEATPHLGAYYQLVESLVSFRDFQLAHEIPDFSWALTGAGACYRYRDHAFASGRHRDAFRSYVTSRYLQLVGLSNSEIRPHLRAQGIQIQQHGLMQINSFVSDEVPAWMDRFGRSRPPTLSRPGPHPVFRFEPRGFLSARFSKRHLRETEAWFFRLFNREN